MILAAAILMALLAGCGMRQPRTARGDPRPGGLHFQSYCAACHQYDGQGMGDAPPLDRSPWVTGPEERLIKLVLHGVRGPMQVSGRTYDLEMPGFAPVMSDAQIAALLTFVRNRFGGLATPVQPQTVSRVRSLHPNRTEYWSVEELLREP